MPEVRTIDANALKKDLSEFNYEMALRIVDTQPTIEPEVRHGEGCEYCKGRSYTKKPLTVTTRTMKRVDVCFNFCPNCGRDMRATDTNADSKGGDDNG